MFVAANRQAAIFSGSVDCARTAAESAVMATIATRATAKRRIVSIR
jgi:hypothetical protein